VNGATPPQVARRRQRRLLVGAALLGGFAVALFTVFWLIDYYLVSPLPSRDGPLGLLFSLDNETLQNELGSLAQVIVAVLAIAITVVSIVVQLAATRYTSRIADMFFRDRTNLAIMGFFVVACIDAVWLSLAVSGQYVPRATVVMTLLMVTGSLLVLVPYFAHVFDFLDPEKVILRIGQQVIDAARGQHAAARQDVPTRQAAATASLEHLADVAMNAVSQKDKVIASHTLSAMRDVLVRYQAHKGELPPGWFSLDQRMREDPDFIALTPDSMRELEAQRAWVEWKGLRHFRAIFAETLKHLPEMAHVVAIETRYVAESALGARDGAVTGVTVKFFNTYVRIALNARDVRATYNVLHQYRQFAERLMAEGMDDEVAEIGRYFRYYGQTAHAQQLGFVTETAAYDLSALCERAFESGARCHDALLRTFLEVDKEAETSAEEQILRGVRKAQVKLAAFYLLRKAEPQARVIFRDMVHERPARLASIRNELLAIAAKDFWEVTDRGTNFDYLDDARKATLETFFDWFANDDEPTRSGT
jgi:hypothetical protein